MNLKDIIVQHIKSGDFIAAGKTWPFLRPECFIMGRKSDKILIVSFGGKEIYALNGPAIEAGINNNNPHRCGDYSDIIGVGLDMLL